MKTFCIAVLLLLLWVCSIGCSSPKQQTYKFVTDHPWPVGEARLCTLDGQFHQAHCFPPENLFTTEKVFYIVTTTLVDVKFDSNQWGYGVTCRLDSYSTATCIRN